ncbi:hypothetical protein [Pilibacter termitis]|uniref:hypothetical protein n=1 Tax=Pilibacter termitis TaxID=263852 RepID=UPI00118505E6|nr:hypothetical protein [Pilibacter termitis]
MRSTLRTVAKLQPLAARHRKATRGGQGFVAVSHSIYLLETQFPVLLRTATEHFEVYLRKILKRQIIMK